jgi:hypothetical protein
MEGRMKKSRCCFWAWLIVAALVTTGFAQKVKVGYDESAEFSKYKTYTWAKPQTQPTRPLLYETVVGTIDDQLKAKGFERIDKNGDLTLIAAGGIGFGNNLGVGTPILSTYDGPPPNMNATMWTGADGSAALLATTVAQGTLILEFVDRSQNKAIWNGTVAQNLDPEQKEKSLDLVEKAIVKLLKGFPPKASSK